MNNQELRIEILLEEVVKKELQTFIFKLVCRQCYELTVH